ncbi:hypothetical protein Aph02nite_04290 [Actinoplanes philippinensis]|nr:hypothetical protein Aph02nite_04290 [Actinoplanes philippinensis]
MPAQSGGSASAEGQATSPAPSTEGQATSPTPSTEATSLPLSAGGQAAVPVSPAGRARRPEAPSGPSLSPSRAADFKTCPLLFRFRTVDKLPETPSADQIRGTLVHAVLERLFDLPAADRTPEAAAALVTPEWERLLEQEPELAAVFATDPPARGRPVRTTPSAESTGGSAAASSSPGSSAHGDASGDPAAPSASALTPGDTAARPASDLAAGDTAADPASAPSSSAVTDPASARATSDTAANPTPGLPASSTAAGPTPGLPASSTAAGPTPGFTTGDTAAGPTSGLTTGDTAAGAASGLATGAGPADGLMRDPAAIAAEIDATGQAALIDLPAGAAEAARIAAFLAGARDLLAGYFAVEDPRRLQPAERETLISTTIGEDLLLRGYIDRLDVSPAGDLRVVDYKTGGAPREAFEGRALFQLKFYALVLWRARGVVPRALRLLYLKDAEALDYSPEAGELERFERTLIALSTAIERAKRDRDFRPKPSRLCGWCSHQALCPEFGGTPPPFPESVSTSAFTPDTEPDRVGALLRDDPLG